jgi:hypothetical protein
MTSCALPKAEKGKVRPADAAAELLRRRRARRSLLSFTEYTYPDYQTNWHHRLIADTLDRFVRGEIIRLMLHCPPRTGKSELCSRRLPSFLLGQNPDEQIIACSNTSGLASDLNRDCQRVMGDPLYARLFPDTRLASRNNRSDEVRPLKNSEVFEVVGRTGRYQAAGVGQAIVGRGFSVGIIDDPFSSREEADSPTQRENVWKWYTGDFYTRRGPGARILINHTRWNTDDLAGRLLKLAEEDPRADQWTVLSLPAIREEVGAPGDDRAPGEALWPDRYPLAELAKTKAANPYDWDSQYQQHPRAQGSVEWPDEHFGWDGFWFDEWPERCEIKVMSLDPSKGRESKAGDYQGLILYGRTADGTEWVEADLSKRPMTAARSPAGVALTEGMVEHALEMYRAFDPECLAIETNTFQQLLTIPFRALAREAKIDLRICEVNNYVNKKVRIRRLGDPLAQRKMRFRRTAGTRLLVEQLRQFPVGDHDDGPDALEMARRTAIELWNGKQPRRRR